MLKFLKSVVQTNLSVKLLRRKKKIHASFAVAPQTAKIMATLHKCLVKMEQALKLYKATLWKERPHSHNFYYSILL